LSLIWIFLFQILILKLPDRRLESDKGQDELDALRTWTWSGWDRNTLLGHVQVFFIAVHLLV